MTIATLHIRTWFDRVNGNTYSSGWLTKPTGQVLQVFPMQYGQPGQLARDVSRARGWPLDLIDVRPAVEVRKREMYAHIWRTENHTRQPAPVGTKWAGYIIRCAEGGYLDSAPTLALARVKALQRMSGGMRECHVDRLAEGAVRRVFVPIVSYISETAP